MRARLRDVRTSRLLDMVALGITDYGKAQVLKGWKEALEWVLGNGGNETGNAPGCGQLRRKAGVAKQPPATAAAPDSDAGT